MEFNLRPFVTSDAASIAHHANNSEVARFMTDAFPHPYTEEHAKAFIEFATKDDPVHIFTIEVNGEAAGGIGIHPQTDIMRLNAEMGYWLGEQYWGHGIVPRAIHKMIDFAFATYPIDRIYARPFGNNIRSQRVLEKCGFILEARIENNILKNGEKLDELIYAVRRDNKQ